MLPHSNDAASQHLAVAKRVSRASVTAINPPLLFNHGLVRERVYRRRRAPRLGQRACHGCWALACRGGRQAHACLGPVMHMRGHALVEAGVVRKPAFRARLSAAAVQRDAAAAVQQQPA